MSRPQVDDATLRESVEDPGPLRERASQLADARDAAGLGELADVLRLLDRLDEAEDAARRAVAAADRGDDPRDRGTARLRLGRVLRRRGNHAAAEDEFAVALSEAEQVGDEALRALALHDRGASRFDEGRTAEAERDFTAALQVRRRLQAPAEEIAASEQAVTAAMRRLVAAAGE